MLRFLEPQQPIQDDSIPPIAAVKQDITCLTVFCAAIFPKLRQTLNVSCGQPHLLRRDILTAETSVPSVVKSLEGRVPSFARQTSLPTHTAINFGRVSYRGKTLFKREKGVFPCLACQLGQCFLLWQKCPLDTRPLPKNLC